MPLAYDITARTPTGALVAFSLPYVPPKGAPFELTGVLAGVFRVGACLRTVQPSGELAPALYIRLDPPGH